MARPIDADELKASLKKFRATGNVQGYLRGIQDALNELFPQIIDDVPTADVEPVRHGLWVCVEADPEKVWCNCCKTVYRSSDLLNIGADDGKVNFCPNCGARMAGD